MRGAGDALGQRNPRLDHLRAAAIILVLAFHSVQMSPSVSPLAIAISSFGKYGVDLFFVLSGWLIGGLFWREARRTGKIELGRFWARRWVRTIPPYAVALITSWSAVFIARQEPFDYAYLLFLQNYERELPFFLVSWSLCVEEHFYLIAPLCSITLLKVSASKRAAVWLIAALLPTVLRLLAWSEERAETFGYLDTATHLHADGLVLGFGLSAIAVAAPLALAGARRWLPGAAILCLASLVALEAIGGQLRYALWPLVIAVLFASIMLRWAWLPTDAPAPSRGLADPILSAIGLGAYSIYLTHPLCIHAANILAQKAPWPSVSYWPIAISLIAIAALGFYFLVERPCIVWRDRWIPSSNKPSVRIAHHDIAKGPAL